jgi:acyl-CoA hydrolase
LGGSTIAAFDNTGAIFAAAVADTQYILLYDVSAMDSVRWPA